MPSFARRGLSTTIESDGGINDRTIADFAAAGVDAFVVGSGIFGTKDYRATFARLRGEVERGLKSAQMITIRNSLWGARISETGAELKSLASLSSGQEYIWNGDPAWWNGSAPVLFPVIGGLKGGEYSYEGRTLQASLARVCAGKRVQRHARRATTSRSSPSCPARRPARSTRSISA